MPVPLDEYPVHQLPISMEYVGTGDRHFYDRCYFNGHDRSGEIFFLTGLGVYPNLGVTDAYLTVRRHHTQWAVRFSGALGDDRLHPSVGDYSIEVIEPLKTLRIMCDGDAYGLGCDLTWQASLPAVNEAPHVTRRGRRLTIDASRFNQVGTWSGVLRVDGEEIAVDPARWISTRDRSWGLRPVGEPEPTGRPDDQPFEGFWWVISVLHFIEFSIVFSVQEGPDGFRTHNDATRVWKDGRVDQLGWPEIEIRYRSGSRDPRHATVRLRDPSGEVVTLEIDVLTSIALHLGAGYGTDPEWHHGLWKGSAWESGITYDHTDPEFLAKMPLGVVDHACRAVCNGVEGWGLFEHGTVGRHDPSGFTEMASVAP
jgi:hypothetical protein